MNSCSHCGAPFEGGNKYTCGFCGASIKTQNTKEEPTPSIPIIETPVMQEMHDDSFDFLTERPTVLTVTCVIAWILFALEFIGYVLLDEVEIYTASEFKYLRFLVFGQAYAYFLIWNMKKKGIYIFLLIAIIDTIFTILINGEPLWFDIIIYIILLVIPLYYVERMDN
ncbi:peptidoglycan/LPS O-acetylase OafA/YrhL [Dysgonomonas sp. PFB1-18]|uniref:hypothetical protein n=1 Tax=unclassified Dysgonomonas TaxID=2630389 RepID=UPI0024735518|nr:MULTISPECIES: hypothetical protein [unclassified Dysgonomonas]MDH6307404.1 peptidoglycan/LPS O-acetylase OafA/YrhL [Dysgonomonas sp. PF1-14]MDH6337322.1 peptidoglycan/LPS O-acetylase OafA/YrhL [Dysgonomonas sp. PF1-16]MDH6379246.1 peptidoglycan/LPS O-acetylase OafA/YrhL [Dysgonomonas sp. PFB1-18]MDH6396116.1 peptidoglycan/LPS O-acetylase OafA/YrhL [Dysgonomonas sp. PF1-23]